MSAPADLQTFIRLLESANQLERVSCEVDPFLEAAAIINNVCKSPGGGKALLFDNIKGSSIPLAANLYGSAKRTAMALGVASIDASVKKMEQALAGFKDISSGQALTKIVASVQDATIQDSLPAGESQRTECRLTDLPVIHSWPGDGGKYLTLAQVFTRKPDCQQQNCGMYRIQVIDDGKALLRCHPGSGGEMHIKAWRVRGEPMPIAIVLGGPPCLTWVAGVSLPNDVEETSFISWLTGNDVAMSRCKESDLKVPATAEIIIEGTIHPGEQLPEGPFGNHTGLYSEQAPAPVVRVSSVSLRNQSIYPCTVVGPPPMENVALAQAATKMLVPLVKHDLPWLDDVFFPAESIYHRIAFVQLTQGCSLGVAEIAALLYGTLLFKSSRKIILFDNDVDLNSLNDAYWHFINKAAINSQGDSRLIDARTRPGQKSVQHSFTTNDLVRSRWDDYGL